MTDKNTNSKYSKNYKMSISNPKIFDAIKMIIAILIALAITFVILCLISDDPVNAITTILFGPLSKKRYIGAVIESFISFAFAGLAAGVMFKAGGFNMGAEGIFIITGTLVAWIASSEFTTNEFLHPLCCYLGAMAMGGALMTIPSFLKSKYGTNEMVISLMSNSIYAALAAYITRTYIGTPQRGSLSSKDYLPSARIDYLYEPLRISPCFILLLVVMIILYLIMNKTKLGYQMRLSGSNPKFAEYSGISAFKLSITTAVIAGMLCGLGSTTQLLTQTSYYTPSQSLVGIGFSGMLLAMLGKNNPIGIVIASFFIKYLEQGAAILYFVDSAVPSEIVAIVEGIIIMLISSQNFLRSVREKKLLQEGLEEHAG